MRMSKLVGRTVKETPRDAELPSHRFMLRGGYLKQFSAGVYGLMPLAMRSIAKIEAICREEMNAVDGQEVKLPCLSTKELWEESGRYGAIGKDMFRLKDRNEKDMVLNMTHEEPVVHMARTELTSYKQLPAMLYQIQTKFRDEPRPRGGLIRTREFVMKDAYSFHADENDLHTYYKKVHNAYTRFFTRCGAKNFASVISDNGMFGGNYSHEFMALVPTGEDTLITCSACDYKANKEIASSPYVTNALPSEQWLPLAKISTPNQKSIEELVKFCNQQESVQQVIKQKISPQNTAKAVLYQNTSEELVVAFVRGDLEIEQQKLTVTLQMELLPASPAAIERANACAGSTGPLGLNLGKCWVVIDPTVEKSSNLVVGANQNDAHLANFNLVRDWLGHAENKPTDWERSRIKIADIASARAGDPCPKCGSPLQETRGIEIGNIFHLGTKYSAAMGFTFLDSQGKAHTPVMGCYGIGITRLLPTLMEEHHDERGPILPLPVAPYQVHLCALNLKEMDVAQAASALYECLVTAGIETLFDDRDEKPGSQFADADLIGIPFRIIVSPKTLAAGGFEFKYRDNRENSQIIATEQAVSFIQKAIQREMLKFLPSELPA